MASSSSSSGAFDAIIPSASTFGASSSGTKHPPFDVFINHCGKDVKQTLASRIYELLNATGLKVFLDKPELNYGDLLPKALEEAMATATIYIAIFSEHYAESPWCLLELEYMVKTRRTIIPIFYKVDPSVLRWTVAGAEKTYIEAFRRHQEKNRYAPEALQRWKEVLQEASLCNGGIINSIDISATPSKEVKQGSIKGRKDTPAKGKEKALKLDIATTQKLVDYDTETDKTDFPENSHLEEEEDTDADDLISNFDGYPDSEDNNGKGNEETNSEGNTEQSKADIEGVKACSKEKEDHQAKTVPPTSGDEKRKASNLNVDSTGGPQEGQLETRKHNDNVESSHHENAENISDSLQRGVTLTFLDSAKTKVDTMLKVDSWIYNEIMGLKKKVDTLLQNQESINAKIGYLDGQMGNIPEKISRYEQNLKLLIKESGTKMDQVTASICEAAATLRKRDNVDTMAVQGPSKRTRQSARKIAKEVATASAAETMHETAEIGKEAARLIMELQ